MVFLLLRRGAPLLVAMALLSCLIGCGRGGTGDVTGTVTLKGKPPKLKGLRIVFAQGEGEPITAQVGDDKPACRQAVHLSEDLRGFLEAEVMEGQRAGDDVERAGREWERQGVALDEGDATVETYPGSFLATPPETGREGVWSPIVS